VIEAGRAIGETVQSAGAEEGDTVTIQTNQRLADAVAQLEHAMIRRTLRRVDGHVGLAASALGISRKGFYLKRRRLGFDDL
jgi:DNA-binding NtrC family response regulator